MIDTITNQPLKAEYHLGDWTTIRLPLTQVPQVSELLDAHSFRYRVWDGAISDMGKPYVTEITFYPGTDPKKVQAALDSKP